MANGKSKKRRDTARSEPCIVSCSPLCGRKLVLAGFSRVERWRRRQPTIVGSAWKHVRAEKRKATLERFYKERGKPASIKREPWSRKDKATDTLASRFKRSPLAREHSSARELNAMSNLHYHRLPLTIRDTADWHNNSVYCAVCPYLTVRHMYARLRNDPS